MKAKVVPEVPESMLASRDLTPKRVMAATGLTYRQINDWDARGALPHSRRGKRGWRAFSIQDVVALRLAREFRDDFSTPLTLLGSLIHWLVGEPWDGDSYQYYYKTFHTRLLESAKENIRSIRGLEWREPERSQFLALASLSIPSFYSEEVFETFGLCGRLATEDDGNLRHMAGAFMAYTRACSPIGYALLAMEAGEEPALYTDFKGIFGFMMESEFADPVMSSFLLSTTLVLRPVSGLINEVLEAVGAEPIPVPKKEAKNEGNDLRQGK